MPKILKTMLSWIILFPLLTTILLIGIDYVRGEAGGLTSYLPYLVGFAVSGIATYRSIYLQ
ncbi:hypothetical protein [Bacillus sp. JCM 19041]|uniref:hypothetical protein n=1 Tax=Bacillus sp. JCM 19041 TaxID=1460637 RepID=UPI000B27D6D6